MLLFVTGCTGDQAQPAVTGSPATTTASAAGPAEDKASMTGSPTAAASTSAVRSIDCQTGQDGFKSLEEAWRSDRRLTSCETTLNLRHKQTRKEQQAVRAFRSYAEDTTAFTALEELYGICAAKDAPPDFYQRANRAVLQGALILCPNAPHARALKAE